LRYSIRAGPSGSCQRWCSSPLYALDPINFALPFVGAVDDFVLLPILLHLVLRLLPAHIGSGLQGLAGSASAYLTDEERLLLVG